MGGPGRGKGKCGPPPPPRPGAEAKAELQQARGERLERARREAQEAIAHAKELEAKKRYLEARLPTLRSYGVADVPWDAALLGTHLCGGKGGGGGVLVVELPGSTAVCLRSGNTILAEAIADTLSTVVGARVARMRLVEARSDEARAIMEACRPWQRFVGQKDIERMESLLESMDPESAARMRAMLHEPPACAVLEFVPGAALDTATVVLEAPPPGLLAGLGGLCALDLLLNNMDRIPLPCWDNSGNLTNAIVTAAGEIVGIDQQVNRIEPGPSLDAYLGKVRDLSAQVLRGSAPAVARSIATAIQEHCSVELSDSSLDRVIEGMGAVLRTTALAVREGGLAEALAATVARLSQADLDRPGVATLADAGAVAAMDADFVQRVAGAVAEACGSS